MPLDPVTIGRYRVLGTLGEGGMGTVYLADDPLLKRSLAIKVVRGGLEKAEVLARFRREAEISARLSHPNLITIFDVGEEPGLGPFLAMEFVDGDSLAELIATRALCQPEAYPRAIGLLLQAMEAVETVHRAGIVHRDIKPENFLVSSEGRLKLMDFGIARGDGLKITTTAAFMGTPGYAAPELLTGGAPTEASDRWAVALIAFEMLTGRSPFGAESVGAVLYKIVHTEPHLPEDLDPALRAVFARALHKDPAQRHESLRSFMDELVRALPIPEATRQGLRLHLDAPTAGAPRTIFGHSTSELRTVSLRRRRGLWAALAALAVIGAGAGWLALREPPRRLVAILSDPPGATITLDDTAVGTTPIAALDVTDSHGLLTADLRGYNRFVHKLQPGDHAIRFKLTPGPWEVAVRTEPPGAEAFLDGAFAGSTPIPKLTVPAEGTHTLRLVRPGYLPWSALLERDKPLPDPIPLQAAPAKAAAAPRPAAAPAKAPAVADGAGPEDAAAASEAPAKEPGKVRRFFKKLFGKEKKEG
jgi:serine/threonine-protein kinase